MNPPVESVDAFLAEARRLGVIADEAEAQLGALLSRAEAAQDVGAPAPSPAVIEAARTRAQRARAAADAAYQWARREAQWREDRRA